MRCLYEVLGVERSSDEGTIKTAYRRGALQWHPGWLRSALKGATAAEGLRAEVVSRSRL